MCLQETIKEVNIKGYRSFCSLRKDGVKRINHGGVATLIANELTGGISHLKNLTNSSDILVIKI